MKRLCSTVLIMEAIVIGLAIPVAIQIDHASPRAAGTAGGVAAVAAVLFAVLARWRLSWALAGGSVLQVLVIVAGAVVPVMYFLGAIFAALWAIGIWLGHRVESVQ
jgi:4-diphosphocytidyl-2C-methyl-D-erythritol kinase